MTRRERIERASMRRWCAARGVDFSPLDARRAASAEARAASHDEKVMAARAALAAQWREADEGNYDYGRRPWRCAGS